MYSLRSPRHEIPEGTDKLGGMAGPGDLQSLQGALIPTQEFPAEAQSTLRRNSLTGRSQVLGTVRLWQETKLRSALTPKATCGF